MGRGRNGGASSSSGRQRTIAEPEVQYRDVGGEEEVLLQNDLLQELMDTQPELLGREYEVIRGYQTYAFGYMNNYLRKGIEADDGPWMAERMVTALENQILDQDIIVYRGQRQSKRIVDLFNSSGLVGTFVDDKGFTSTTLSRSEAKRGFTATEDMEARAQIPGITPAVMYRLKAKKGLHAHVMRDTFEKEIVFQRNSRVRVTSATMVNGIIEVEGEIIQ